MNQNNQNNQSQNRDMLFYANGCKVCAELMQRANKYDILKRFNLICVSGKEEFFFKNGIKEAPTIIFSHNKSMLIGMQCMTWLNNILFQMHQTVQNRLSNNELHAHLYNNQQNQQNQINNQQINNQNNNQQNNNQQNRQINSQQQTQQINNNQQNQQNNQLNKQQMSGLDKLKVNREINPIVGFVKDEHTNFSDKYAYVNIDQPFQTSFIQPNLQFDIYTAPNDSKLVANTQNMLMQTIQQKRDSDKNEYKKSIDELHQKIINGEKVIWGDDNIKLND